ncbi:MAG TPA: hypothetical protein V6C64_07625 [Microcoleaceae cyanobacterium]|jgi:hypothetical protein
MPSSLCFLVHTYQDEPQAKRLLAQIREFYPDSDLVLITDGEPDAAADVDTFCDANQVQLVVGDRLKLMEFGSDWVERMFLVYLELSLAPTLIKLDADAIMHRAFVSVPALAWFGTLTNSFFRPSCRGGCVGFSRVAIERALASGMFGNERYTRLPFGYRRYSDELRFADEVANDEWVLSADGVVADVMFRLGIAPKPWTENNIQFRKPLPDNLLPFSVTHPHHDL